MGYLLICLFYLALSGLGYILLLLFYNAFLWQPILEFYTLFLKLSIIIGFCLVFCCLFSLPLIALLCSIFLYFTAQLFQPALRIIMLGEDKFQETVFKFIYYLLPNMDKLDIKSLVVYGRLPPANFFLWISLYSGIYILMLWLIARFIFIKKEY
jgi:hypothetical protein